MRWVQQNLINQQQQQMAAAAQHHQQAAAMSNSSANSVNPFTLAAVAASQAQQQHQQADALEAFADLRGGDDEQSEELGLNLLLGLFMWLLFWKLWLCRLRLSFILWLCDQRNQLRLIRLR